MTGTEVKSMIKGAGLKCWEVAYALNMQDSNFSRRLRKPFNESEVNNIKKIINTLSAEKRSE
jgi:predicted XRE-type DNA-binding protein